MRRAAGRRNQFSIQIAKKKESDVKIKKSTAIVTVFAACQILAGMIFAQSQIAATSGQSVPGPIWNLPTGAKTLSANGYPMAYFERGPVPTVVLVHGSLNDNRYWTPQRIS